MDAYWRKLALTATGRPEFNIKEQEVELFMEPNVSVYFGEKKMFHQGTSWVTSHRILCILKSKQPESYYIPLKMISSVENKKSMFSNPKIVLHFHEVQQTHNKNKIDDSWVIVPSSAPSTYIQLSFNGKGHHTFYTRLSEALSSKAWEKTATLQKETIFSTSSAGIGGIMRMVEKEKMHADRSIDQAFSDLKNLMASARDMVELTERFSAQLEERRKALSDDKENQQESEEFNNLLVNLGMVSPVTKKTAGSAYHVELASQLADFIATPLRDAGGMMALTDVYCLYNRARGTELISPEDLLHSCEMFGQKGSRVRNIKMRKFGSGVFVLQETSQSDDHATERIKKLVEEFGSLTPIQLSRKLNLSLHLAKEQLLHAEQNLSLCRDETLDGIEFYSNFFVNYK